MHVAVVSSAVNAAIVSLKVWFARSGSSGGGPDDWSEDSPPGQGSLDDCGVELDVSGAVDFDSDPAGGVADDDVSGLTGIDDEESSTTGGT